ncbi:MAG: hypothetical protein ACFFAE_22195, partial [Candidatus Hodarchaeota archaeon]
MPPCEGSAGADTVAMEVCPRYVRNGFDVIAYNRVYNDKVPERKLYKGVQLIYLKTFKKSGFDSFFHSLKATYHIIRYNTANIVFIYNGGNSLWAIFLRLFGKKVFVGVDGMDWKREKWPWYVKIYLYLS